MQSSVSNHSFHTTKEPSPNSTLRCLPTCDPDDSQSDSAQQTHSTHNLAQHKTSLLQLITKSTKTQRVFRVQPTAIPLSIPHLLIISVSHNSPLRPRPIGGDDRSILDLFTNSLEEPLGSLVSLQIFKSVSFVSQTLMQIGRPFGNTDITGLRIVIDVVREGEGSRIGWGAGDG